jgi:osmotically inducible protein OsmC
MDALYVASATATGGRAGKAVSSDGSLEVTLVPPPELGGPGTPGTNPEQLFAAGYSACFLSALTLVASKRGVDASAATVTADVALNSEGRAFKLSVALKVAMPGVDPEQAQKFVEVAHEVCPYSNATRGNIDVDLVLQESAPTA